MKGLGCRESETWTSQGTSEPHKVARYCNPPLPPLLELLRQDAYIAARIATPTNEGSDALGTVSMRVGRVVGWTGNLSPLELGVSRLGLGLMSISGLMSMEAGLGDDSKLRAGFPGWGGGINQTMKDITYSLKNDRSIQIL